MNFVDFKSNHLLEIASWLNFQELNNFQLVCKSLRDLLRKYNLIERAFFQTIGIEYSPDCYPCNSIHDSICEQQDNLSNTFMPYYTNGGISGSDPRDFIDKLVRSEAAYRPISIENILVAYAFSQSMRFDFDSDSVQHKLDTNVHYFPEIEEEANLSASNRPYIREIEISRPIRGMNNFEQILMCFSSVEKVEDLSVFSKFYSCRDADSAIEIGKTLQMKGQHIKHEYFETVQFLPSHSKIQVICWVNCKINPRVSFKLCYPRFAIYFYLLIFTSGYFSHSDIRISNVIPFASIIQVKNA